MARIDEKFTERFHQWERRGRGWQVFPELVSPEPSFRPFPGHYIPATSVVDDGRRPTALSSFIQRLSRKLSTEPLPPPVIPETEDEPEPDVLIRDATVELQVSLPAKLDISREAFEQFLLNLSLCREPVAFELLGQHERVFAQFVTHPDDAPLVRRQLQAHFPEAGFQSRDNTLEQAWEASEGDEALAVEFGLAQEFMLPLASGKLDPFIGIVAALSELQPGELGLFQVIFQPVRHPWAESIIRSVTHEDGKPFFVNEPKLTDAAKEKTRRPLFAAVVRILVRSQPYDRVLDIARDLAGSLRVFAHPQGNELIPLENDAYPFEEHIEDALRRQSRRSGMLLNADELTGFVHLPSSAVRSTVLARDTGKTKAAPMLVRQEKGLLLGDNIHADASAPVRLTPDQRVRHCHIIGVPGTGKSTLLFNLIRQDINNGEGVAVLDPHGDLIEQILGVIPQNRIADVVLVDPSDEDYSVGFNVLSAHSDLEKNLIASDLVSVFQRLSASWGDQMGSVLQNAILAFLESDQGGTLADLRRFLIEPAFREKFLSTVRDPDIVYYWIKGFAQLTGNKSIGPLITRLDTFLAPKPIRYMVSQQVNRLNFGNIIDTGKIFLAKLPQGQMGKENAFLLGSLLVSKFQQLAMSRQAQKVAQRKDFWLYIDEFQNFITPSMTEILTGARKYRLGLVLAHQELRQLERDREVASAVLAHPYTRIVFRVGDADARSLENGFSFFEAKDLQNLETGRAICRVEKADYDFNLSVPFPKSNDPKKAEGIRMAVIAASRARYSTSRAEVEAALAQLHSHDTESESVKAKPTTVTLPKAAEVAKATVSEKDVLPESTAKPAEPPSATAHEPRLPRDLGRGGTQHKAIQKRVKEAAEALGFRSSIEKEILEGKGSIDLYLERAGKIIACEIAITNTVDYEVGNVLKCLKAGIPNVAVIGVDTDHLQKIKAAVIGSLGREATHQVDYYDPDQFIAHLKVRIPRAPELPETPRKRRGYQVTRSVPKLPNEELKQREDEAIRSIAEAMKKKPK